MLVVTGGLGYLGARLTQALLQQNWPVTVTSSRKKLPALPKPLSAAQLSYADLQDQASLVKIFKNKQAIIHLAALNAQQCADDPAAAWQVNAIGTFHVLQAALKANVEKILYFSTAHVYGAPLAGHYDEDCLPRPLHPYASSHRLAEDILLEAAIKNQIAATVLRLSNCVGAPIDSSANCWMLLCNDLCRQVAEKKTLLLHSPANMKRDFLPISAVSEVVSHYLSADNAMQASAQIFNCCAGQSQSLVEIVELIRTLTVEQTGHNPEVVFPAANEIVLPGLSIANDKIKRFGYRYETAITTEIEQLLTCCLQWFSKKESYV